ncbi:MAG: penicillin-binding protein activator [Deltaproteobacteria bacterium]|nr:penicillin-binding protein activator [Deltaproteobacteria bacterium]
MERKFRGFSTLVVLVAFVSGILLLIGSCEKEPNVYKIGAILPLTGDAAIWGQNCKKGIDLAVDQANKKSIRGKNIQVIYEDSKALAKTGVDAMNKLVNIDKVPVVIDDAVSSVALAIMPIAQKNQILVTSIGSTNPELSKAGKFFFRVWNSDAEEGLFSADYVFEKLNFHNMAIFYINNEYGRGLRDVFEKEFNDKGGTIVIIESFEQNATDVRGQLTKIKNANPDGIYLVGYPDELPKVIKQAHESGIKTQFIATVAFEDPSIVKNAGEAAEGVIYPFPKAPDESNPALQNFKTLHKEKYGEAAGVVSDAAYDAASLVIHCIDKGGYNGPKIQEVMATIKDWQGASGEITFDENGDVHKPMIMKTVKDGVFVELK